MSQHISRRGGRSARGRTAVDLQSNTAPQLTVARNAFRVQRDSQSQREARALTEAFGVGADLAGTLLANRSSKNKLKGNLAAEAGREITPDEAQNDSFMLGHGAVMAERTNTEMREDAFELYNTTDTSKWDAAQVGDMLEKQFSQQFDGVDLEDDLAAAEMRLVLPEWSKTVNLVIQKHQQDAQVRLQEDLDLTFIDIIDADIRETGTINLNRLNEFAFPLYSKNTNQAIIDLVLPIASARGLVDVILELQDKRSWHSSAAAPGGQRKFDKVIAVALKAARTNKAYLSNLDFLEDAREHATAQQEVGNSIMTDMMDGKVGSVRGSVADAVESGVLDWQVGNQLLQSANSLKNLTLTDTAPDTDKLFQLEISLSSLTQGMDDLNRAADDGILGSGVVGTNNYSRLAATIRAAENHEKGDLLFRAKIEEFLAVRTADLLAENTWPALKVRRVKSLRRVYELMDSEGPDNNGQPRPGLTLDKAIEKVNQSEEFKVLPDKWWRQGSGVVTLDITVAGWRVGGQYSGQDILNAVSEEDRQSDSGSRKSDETLAVWLLETGVLKTESELEKLLDEIEGNK